MALPQFLLNLLFPPRCPFCDRPVEAVVSRALPPLPGERCLAGRRPGRGDGRGLCPVRLRRVVPGAPARLFWRRFKFSGRRDYAKAYGPVLAQAVRTYLPGTYDLITWVPVSPKTLRRRGYDQAQLLAQETARALPPSRSPAGENEGHPAPSPP